MVKEINIPYELDMGGLAGNVDAAFAGIVHDTLLTASDRSALDVVPDEQYFAVADSTVMNQVGRGRGYGGESGYGGAGDIPQPPTPAGGAGGGGDVPPTWGNPGSEGGFEESDDNSGDVPGRRPNDDPYLIEAQLRILLWVDEGRQLQPDQANPYLLADVLEARALHNSPQTSPTPADVRYTTGRAAVQGPDQPSPPMEPGSTRSFDDYTMPGSTRRFASADDAGEASGLAATNAPYESDLPTLGERHTDDVPREEVGGTLHVIRPADDEYTIRAFKLLARTGLTFKTPADETRHIELIASQLRERDVARAAVAEQHASEASDIESAVSASPELSAPVTGPEETDNPQPSEYDDTAAESANEAYASHYILVSPPHHPLPLRSPMRQSTGPVPLDTSRHEDTREFWKGKIDEYRTSLAAEGLSRAERLGYEQNIVMARERMGQMSGSQIETAIQTDDRLHEPLHATVGGIEPSLLEGPGELASFAERFRQWIKHDSRMHGDQ